MGLSMPRRAIVDLHCKDGDQKCFFVAGAFLCVFSGSVTTSAPRGTIIPIAEVSKQCTKGYGDRGYWVPANVKLGETQQWLTSPGNKIETGSPPSNPGSTDFQLTLINGSTLALWRKGGLHGHHNLTVGLDGAALASGPT